MTGHKTEHTPVCRQPRMHIPTHAHMPKHSHSYTPAQTQAPPTTTKTCTHTLTHTHICKHTHTTTYRITRGAVQALLPCSHGGPCPHDQTWVEALDCHVHTGPFAQVHLSIATRTQEAAHLCVCVYVCVCACVCACVYMCVRACVCGHERTCTNSVYGLTVRNPYFSCDSCITSFLLRKFHRFRFILF